MVNQYTTCCISYILVLCKQTFKYYMSLLLVKFKIGDFLGLTPYFQNTLYDKLWIFWFLSFKCLMNWCNCWNFVFNLTANTKTANYEGRLYSVDKYIENVVVMSDKLFAIPFSILIFCNQPTTPLTNSHWLSRLYCMIL